MAEGDIPKTGTPGISAESVKDLPIIADQAEHLTGKINDLNNIWKKGPAAVSDYMAGLDRMGPQFASISAFALGAAESFRNLNGSVDSGKVNNYTDQWKQLVAQFDGSPAKILASKEAMITFHSIMGKAGVSASGMTAAAAAMKDGLLDTATAILTNADNMRHLENAFIMTSASGGTMSEFLKDAGTHLENLSTMALKAAVAQNATQKATGATDKAMEDMLNNVKELPGGFLHMSDAMQGVSGDMTILTAAMQYADGAGRKQADVVDDMSQGMLEYGMSMPKSLEYSNQITAASEALGAKMGDVKAAVHYTTDAFKFQVFAGTDADKMTQGMTKSMEAYVTQLKNVGVPIQNAIAFSKDYVDQIHNMSVGQEAFLSQQTGGPGGMMGAIQMELLKKNNPEEFQKKYMESLKKTIGGNMVTQEEGAKSQGAANQYEKEVQFITKGPNALTTDIDKVPAIIAAMKNGGKLEAPEDKRTMEQVIKKGQDIDKSNITAVEQMTVDAKAVQIQGSFGALELVQNTMTAASRSRGGVDGTGAGVATENQARLQSGQMAATAQLPGHAADPVQNFFKDIKGVTPMIVDAFKAAKESANGGNQATPEQERNAEIVSMKNVQANSQNKKEVDAAGQVIKALNMQTSTPGSNMKMAQAHDAAWFNGESTNAGDQVGKAVNTGRGAATGGKTAIHTAGGAGGGGQTGPIPVTLVGSSLTVNFTGTCPHCKTQIHTSEHASVLNPASTR